MREYFSLLSRYNRWANETLYAAVATLAPEEIARDRQGFFGSIVGTLNHILLADRIWVARMLGDDYGWFKSLDQILHDEFPVLRQVRADMDLRIIHVMGYLPLDGELDYVTSKGEAKSVPRPLVLGHVFNHQTHHRGQVHGMLSQIGITPPALDLIYFPHGER